MSSQKILFVDDDEKILRGIQRQLSDAFEISTALGAHEGLTIEADHGPFAVIVSDMRMPEMNGVEYLRHIRQRSPDTVRMILTGFSDIQDTIQAVNEGHVFRFLSKPCATEVLVESLKQGLQQYALIQSERELVEGTLHGCVKVLSDVLALVNPLAFGQASRIRRTVDGLLRRVPVPQPWRLEIAALLSSLGCVTLAEGLLQQLFAGEPLPPAEARQIAQHPLTAQKLLRSIPRLEEVADLIGSLATAPTHLDASALPLEQAILRLASDFDHCELHRESPLHALHELARHKDRYPPVLFDALSDFVRSERETEALALPIEALREGMVLAENIETLDGTLLLAKGHQISASALQRLQNFGRVKPIRSPIKVVAVFRPVSPSTSQPLMR